MGSAPGVAKRRSSVLQALSQPTTPWGRALRLAVIMAPVVALTLADLPICLTAALTGLPCPGCGLSRAGEALVSGDLVTAMQFNPLAPLIVPIAAVGFVHGAVRYVVFGRTNYARWVPWAVGALLAALVVVWIARFFGAFGGPVAV